MKTKTILLLVLTLLMGILIGALTTGRVTRYRVEKIKSWNTREGFRNHLFDIMEATEMQQKALIPVLDSFSNIHWQLMNKNWENQNKFYDSMYQAIQPMMDEQQFDRLMNHRNKMRLDRERKKEKRK